MTDLISRKNAIDVAKQHWYKPDIAKALAELPSAEPEIIRCKDCKWWDKYNDFSGFCMAAKHGYWSEHWDISIRRTYREDFYCADAERRGEEDETD